MFMIFEPTRMAGESGGIGTALTAPKIYVAAFRRHRGNIINVERIDGVVKHRTRITKTIVEIFLVDIGATDEGGRPSPPQSDICI